MNGNWIDKQAETVNQLSLQANGTWRLKTIYQFVEIYNDKGLIVERTNPVGIKHTFTYTGLNLTKITHSSGRYLNLTWVSGKLTSITDTAGNVYTYNYRSGYLGGVSYPDGNRKDYYYENTSVPGALTRITINNKPYAFFTYHADGRGASTYHVGDIEKYQFDYSQNLILGTTNYYTTVTNPLGQKNIYGHIPVNGSLKFKAVSRLWSQFCNEADRHVDYDANGNLDLVVDWKGIITDYNYNDRSELESVIYAKGTPEERTITNTFTPDSVDPKVHRLTRVATSELETNYQYDSKGQIKQISSKNLSANGTIGETRVINTSYQTYSSGIIKQITVDGPRTDVSDIVTSKYDTQGNLTSITNSLGHITTFSNYDALGNVGRVTAPNGLIVDFTYNPRGWLLTKTVHNSTGNQLTTYEYNALGQITKITNALNQSITNEYSDAYRLLKTRVSNGDIISYDYDNMSNVISRKLQNEHTVVTPPPPGCWSGGGGNLFASVNPALKYENRAFYGGNCDPVITTVVTDFFASYTNFDAMGRVHKVIGNNGQSTEYMHDDNSNVKEVIDSYGRKTTLTYDSLNRVKTSTDALGGITRYSYDTSGRITSVTDARGLITQYFYDGFGDLKKIISPDTGITTFTHNKAGQVVTKLLADGTASSYSYDALGRIKTENNGGMIRSYYYDRNDSSSYGKGRLYYVNDNSGQTLYFYDKVGNVIRKRSKIGTAYYNTYYSYNALNQLSTITYPSGHIVTYNFDSLSRVNSVTVKIGTTTKTVVNNLDYLPFGPMKTMTFGNGIVRAEDYDLDYRLKKIYSSGQQSLTYSYDFNNNITNITNGISSNQTQSYGYDWLNRLKSVTSTSGNHSYSFDAVGNRKTHTSTGLTENYTYSTTSNRLSYFNTNGSGRSMSYNNNGQITHNRDYANLTYNGENRLVSYSLNNASYQYNALGQRVSKSSNYGDSIFFYDEAGQLISEGAIKEYIYLFGKPIGLVKNNVLYYIHNDHLGRAERITNQSKGVVWKANNYDYNRTVTQNSIGDYNLGFPGQYWDVEKGSWYNYFRDYDSTTGRYLQSDPIGLAGGVNTYGYVGGNPVNWSDFWGLKKFQADQSCECRDALTYDERKKGLGIPSLANARLLWGPLSAQQANDRSSHSQAISSSITGGYFLELSILVPEVGIPIGFAGLVASYASPSTTYLAGDYEYLLTYRHFNHTYQTKVHVNAQGDEVSRSVIWGAQRCQPSSN